MIRRITVPAWMLSFLLFLLFPVAAAAVDVPAQLESWVPWVLHGQEQRFCTSSSDGKQQFCIWPEPLVMALDGSGGNFSQGWHMKRDGWIALPGSEKLWPQQVKINGEPALVVNRNGQPAIHVDIAGQYDIEGKFGWKSLPESLAVPAGTGIIRLTVNGDELLADVSEVTLWLSRSRQQEAKVEDTVHTQVYRLIEDSIPMIVTSRIEVQVSGKPREILLDWQLPEEQIPLSLQCNLPVKIGTDGRIHMQARPGNHYVTFRSRLQGPVDALTFRQSPLGPETEYWSFRAQNQLRMVKIGGEPSAIDPSQTSIPGEWRAYPAYMVKKGQSLQFETLKRGNPEPPPNNLVLHRTLWLDSDGSGMTIQDNLSGTIHRKPRLEMQPPAALGRMVINGRDQLITRIDNDGPAGVEVRQGRIDGLAVSRIEGDLSFPAGGWGQSISKLSGELVLPPGWTVLHASGIDRVQTWITRWTLLDCFIVLIIVISSLKLLGIVKGGVALIALMLSYHDPDAPVFMWLAVLACIAIAQALPGSRHIHLVKRAKLVLLVGLAIMVLPYSVEQLRIGFFPQLERVYNPYIPPVEQLADAMVDDEKMVAPQSEAAYGGRALSKVKSAPSSALYTRQIQLEEHFDTQAKVQAGPGVPARKWRIVRLLWNGPVEKELDISLLLISPFFNLLIAIVKVAAIYLLAFFMIDLKKGGDVRFELADPGKTAAAALLLMLLPAMAVTPGHCTEYPNQELLDELQGRLLEPAKCFPHCADFEQMHIDLQGSTITVLLQSAAATNCAVRLPAGTGIFWHTATLDGTPSPVLSEGEELWAGVLEGRHEIGLTGRVNRTSLQLQLPGKPHRVEFDGHGEWLVAGLDDNNVPENRLQFTRKKEQQEQAAFAASTLPPLMQVERVLHLGLQWRVETIVTRLSPADSSVFLKIPLLDGESVTDAEFKVDNGAISVPFEPNETRKRFQSVFKKQGTLALTAPDTPEWHEIWRLNASPVWHVEADGFAPILHHSKAGTWQPEWRPWPNEQLTLTVTRPAGVPGPTKAIESSKLTIIPGLRSTTMQLAFTIRSTRGDQQSITLPENAVIQSVRINGREQPTKKDNTVVIPLNPVSQQVEIEWRTPQAISAMFAVPEIDLGSESVNAEIEIQVGNRWVWFVRGPQMGPAILFYSELLIILLVALALGRSGLTPLKSYHWLILGFGLCQSGLIPCLIIAAWFIALKIRQEKGSILPGGWFNFAQAMLVLLTIVAIGALGYAVRNGLLGHPDMLISGNDSSSYLLRWYLDRVTSTLLPQPMVVSIPMIAYRITMLTWALWMSFYLIRWVKWGWNCFTREHIWQKTDIKLRRKKDTKKTE